MIVNKVVEEVINKLNQLDSDFKDTGSKDWSALKRSKFLLADEYKKYPVAYSTAINWIRFQ